MENNNTESVILNCVERTCGSEFEVTHSEQMFFKQQGLQQPKRCQPCRDRKRAEREKQAVGG